MTRTATPLSRTLLHLRGGNTYDTTQQKSDPQRVTNANGPKQPAYAHTHSRASNKRAVWNTRLNRRTHGNRHAERPPCPAHKATAAMQPHRLPAEVRITCARDALYRLHELQCKCRDARQMVLTRLSPDHACNTTLGPHENKKLPQGNTRTSMHAFNSSTHRLTHCSRMAHVQMQTTQHEVCAWRSST